MAHYTTYIDQKYWGGFKSDKSKVDFQKEMQENLKHLHPTNMSDAGAVEYRERYANSIVYVYEGGEDIKHLKK